jgi:hypothetical protein
MLSYENRNPATLNALKAIQFDHPVWTPCTMWALPAAEAKHGAALDDLRVKHRRLFPGFQKPKERAPVQYWGLFAAGEVTDNFGCTWRNAIPGMIGQVVGHPLADWSAFDTWKPPDPEKDAHFGPRNWEGERATIEFWRKSGNLASASGLFHGFMYLLLCDLRGFENAMLDLVTDEPRLHALIDKILHYNVTVTRKLLDFGAEQMMFAEDLGIQKSLPISPQLWRKWIKPCYEAIMGPCRDRGVPVYLHSDGHILPIVPDLIECGVRVLNPQVRANGLDGLRRVARGKVAINLDLDRQLFPVGTPDEIVEHVRECHAALSMPEGGLMLHAEIGPDVPIENIDALMGALEEVGGLPEPA